jgi:hypothetical protein
MSERADLFLELIPIVAEGCVDRFVGRPRTRCPYDWRAASDYAEAWFVGWDNADHLLDIRGQEEARRWLEEAA